MATRKEPEVSMKNTKKELLDAYQGLLKQLEEERKSALQPERKVQERKKEEVLTAVSGLSTDGVTQNINSLKVETGKLLSRLSEMLEKEVRNLEQVQQAIRLKEEELKEIYEIDKSAATLAALIEAQHQEREKFESEIKERKASLEEEIRMTREAWQKEKSEFERRSKERELEEKKRREREEEEYKYSFQRQQELAKLEFEDEKARRVAELKRIEEDMRLLKEKTEVELKDRENRIAESEMELERMREQIAKFPEQQEKAVSQAVKETEARLRKDFDYQKQLQKKEFEGERNVLTARITGLEETLREQAERISKLSGQQELSYQKVQEIAVKAIEGASKVGSFGGLQKILSEPSQQGGEK